METAEQPKKTTFRGQKTFKVSSWLFFPLLALFILAMVNDWAVFGFFAFTLFIINCFVTAISMGVLRRSAMKSLADSKTKIEEAMISNAKFYEEDRRFNPPVINNSDLSALYHQLVHELETRVGDDYLTYFKDPYAVVRQSVILNIKELCKVNPDADLSALKTKIERDELYQRNGEWREVEAEYKAFMRRLWDLLAR